MACFRAFRASWQIGLSAINADGLQSNLRSPRMSSASNTQTAQTTRLSRSIRSTEKAISGPAVRRLQRSGWSGRIAAVSTRHGRCGRFFGNINCRRRNFTEAPLQPRESVFTPLFAPCAVRQKATAAASIGPLPFAQDSPSFRGTATLDRQAARVSGSRKLYESLRAPTHLRPCPTLGESLSWS